MVVVEAKDAAKLTPGDVFVWHKESGAIRLVINRIVDDSHVELRDSTLDDARRWMTEPYVHEQVETE